MVSPLIIIILWLYILLNAFYLTIHRFLHAIMHNILSLIITLLEKVYNQNNWIHNTNKIAFNMVSFISSLILFSTKYKAKIKSTRRVTSFRAFAARSKIVSKMMGLQRRKDCTYFLLRGRFCVGRLTFFIISFWKKSILEIPNKGSAHWDKNPF